MKYIVTGIIALVLFFGFAAIIIDTKSNVGSAEDASFQYKHYTSANASSTSATIVRGGRGVLGTVTVNTTSGQPITLYDAGASAATSTMTAIGVIKASVAEQTFVYNVALEKGLAIVLPAGWAGDITIAVK
jgi:hypothetical protein